MRRASLVDVEDAREARGGEHGVRVGEQRVESRVVRARDLDRTLARRPRRPPVGLRPERMATGWLHEHDLGTQVGEHASRDRGRLPGEIDDTNAGEQRLHYDWVSSAAAADSTVVPAKNSGSSEP